MSLLRSLIFVGLLISVCSSTAAAQTGIPFSDLVQKIDAAETDSITQELAERAVREAVGEQHQPFIDEAIAGAKTAKTHAQNIAEEKYNEVARAGAEATRDELVNQLEKRYPDPDSYVRKMLSSVQDNPDLYKKSVKGVLDANPDAVKAAVTKALKDKLENDVDTAIQSGKDFYKGIFNSVMPGGRIAKKFGTTQADVLLGAVEQTAKTAKRVDNAVRTQVFDCLYRDYRARARSYGPAHALEEFGVAGFDCVEDQRADTPPIASSSDDGSGTNALDDLLLLPGKAIRKTGEGMFRRARETSRLAEMGVDLDEIARLIPIYEKELERGNIPRGNAVSGFSPWLQDRLRKRRPSGTRQARTPYEEFKNRISKITTRLGSSVSWLADILIGKGVAAAQAAKDKTIGNSLDPLADSFREMIEAAIEKALGIKRRDELVGVLPTEDYLPEREVTDFTRGQAIEQLEKEEKTAKNTSKEGCERVPKSKNKKSAADNDGFVPVENYATRGIDGPTDTNKDGCKVIGPAKRELSYVYIPPPGKASPTKKKTDSNWCDGLSAELDKAHKQYSDGHIKVASRTLENMRGSLAKPDHKEECASLRDRVDKNIKKVERVKGLLSDIKSSLTACEPAKLAHHSELLQTSRNKKLRAMYNRISRAQPVANKYGAAKKAYWNGNIERSETLFRGALTIAGNTSRETCVDIKSRIGKNLRRIGKLRDFDNATSAAINDCNLTRIAGLMSHIRGTANPFLDKIYSNLESVPSDCRQQKGNEACRRSFGTNTVASLKEDGSTTCGCTKGFQWHSNKSGKTHQCITDSEAGQLAEKARKDNCRTKFGAGYYPGTPDTKGSYYCLPTKKIARRWCNSNNKGSGWYAGKINAKGSYNCYRKSSRKARKATRSRRARSSASQRRRPRTTRRRTVRRQPNYDARAAAAAATVILQGVQAYQQHKRAKRHRRGGGGGGCSNPLAPGC